jgi:hypothetical protein
LTDAQLYERVELVVHALNASILLASRTVQPTDDQRVGFVSLHGGFHGAESARPNCGDARPAFPFTLVQYPAFHVGDANFFFGEPDLRDLFVGDDCFHTDAQGAAAFAVGAPGGDGLVGAFAALLANP